MAHYLDRTTLVRVVLESQARGTPTAELLEACELILDGLLKRVMSRLTDRDDIRQDCLLRVIEILPRIRTDAHPFNYLTKIFMRQIWRSGSRELQEKARARELALALGLVEEAPASRAEAEIEWAPGIGMVRVDTIINAWDESKSVKAWSLDARCVVSRKTLIKRLKAGWPPQHAISGPPKSQVKSLSSTAPPSAMHAAEAVEAPTPKGRYRITRLDSPAQWRSPVPRPPAWEIPGGWSRGMQVATRACAGARPIPIVRIKSRQGCGGG